MNNNIVLSENIDDIKKLKFIKLDNFSIYPLSLDLYNQLKNNEYG